MSNQPSNSRLKAGCFSAVDVWISDGWSPSFCYQKVAVIGSRLKAGFQTFISDIFQPSKNPFWPPDFLIKIRLRQTSQLKNSSQIDASGSIQCALDRREPADRRLNQPAEPAGWPPAEPAGWISRLIAGWTSRLSDGCQWRLLFGNKKKAISRLKFRRLWLIAYVRRLCVQ